MRHELVRMRAEKFLVGVRTHEGRGTTIFSCEYLRATWKREVIATSHIAWESQNCPRIRSQLFVCMEKGWVANTIASSPLKGKCRERMWDGLISASFPHEVVDWLLGKLCRQILRYLETARGTRYWLVALICDVYFLAQQT
ncbi:hypothetical protein BDBG_16301 [Blastomyces gilchristii SLH14081]|uniref:Uncharacterized protein n=1 Tax=Blastomyces gilchristii (strain SLH14081) TaxID=559298 RepID=A0A179UBG9_BLAGS|nr:uncharacterized protein BDBG_16301 [Blastomyces gilchristii SLH14081]OAT04648.1 hypothetical protein BDBG_16301 [Blastomyces gilchristii SLH14081]